MRFARTIVLAFLCPLLFLPIAGAQQDPFQIRNPIPWGSYQDSEIDTVNLMNGSLALHIPLYSLPQRGRLSLSFSLAGTSPVYGATDIQCGGGSHNCLFVNLNWSTYFDGFLLNLQPRPVLDQTLFALSNQIRYPANSNTFYNLYAIVDSKGGIHELGYDNSNRALLRATDGSGLLYATVSTPYSPFALVGGTIYTPSGIQNNSAIQDPDGNSINFSTNQMTDSLGRVIPSIPTSPASSSTTGCPVVIAPYQAATGSSTWTVPGPNSSQLTYLLCYTSISFHTDFYGGALCPPPDQNLCSPGNYDIAGTQTNVLQSVVLPNGTYWSFTYAAANPSDSSSFGYADLTQIHFPNGGSINYQYSNLPWALPARGVTKRTLDPGNGSQQAAWTYGYVVASPHTLTTVTDSQANDTVVSFSDLAANCTSTNTPALYETQKQAFQGSQSTGKLLLTTATSYQYACTNPQSGTWRGSISIIAVFPTTVTTTLDSGQVSTTNYQYNDGGFVDVQPACTVTVPYTYWCTWTLTQHVPFGLKTSTSVTDYGGATLRTVNTQYLYQQNSSYYPGNFLNQVASATTLNGSGTQVAKTTYGYDENNGSPQGLFAHQTSVNRWLNTTNSNITSKSVYNTQGMVTQSIDPLLNTTTFTYDSTGHFLSQIQYPTAGGVAHIEHFSIDPNTGLSTSHTDQNGQVTSTQYDVMRRITQVNYPDGGKTTNCYTDLGGSTCTQSAPPFQLVTTQLATPDPTVTRTTVFDGLGRVTQTQLSDSDCANGTDKVDTTYDGLGRVHTVSNPYCSTSDPTYGITTYTYDALGRTCTVAPPGGTPQSNCPSGAIAGDEVTVYTGRAVAAFDEGNGTQSVERISQSDALGRLLSVCEVAPGPFVGSGGTSSSSLIGSAGTPAACGQDISGTGFLTTYQYDTLDNLLQVNQSGIAARTFTYDSLSRLLTASNPESGSISYVYDANGNLSTKTSPAPNQTASGTVVTTYSYDALNRLTQRSYNDTPRTPTATFTYDQGSCSPWTCNNLVGRLLKSAAGSNTYALNSYDAMGRIALQLQAIPNANNASYIYPVSYTYDLTGNMTFGGTGQYGGTGGFTYAYNTAARLTGHAMGAYNTYTTDLSGVHYDAAGRITSDTLGNGETESWTYNNRGWPISSASTLNGTNTYSYNITSFAPNGDVLAASDSVNGNWTYSYDPFNRLVGSNKNSGQAVYSYVYDRFGNRWQQNGPNSMQLTFTGNNPSNPQNNNRMDGYTYDAAGNLLNDGTHQYFYDAEGHLIQVDGSSGYCSGGTGTVATACYFYDAAGHRVRNTGVVDCANISGLAGGAGYVLDLSGRWITIVATDANNSGPCNYEVYTGGRHLFHSASLNGYSHTDWLGTERARVCTGNCGGYNQDNCTSLPFGDGLSCTLPLTSGYVSHMHFTGKQRDFETGLDNFGARFDASSFGRFTSPDPENAGADDQDPQSWNAYAYVMDNPLNDTDPDGRSDCPDKDPYSCTVTAQAPPPEPRISYSWRVVWENAGRAAQKANDYLHAAYQAVVNSRTACVATATAAGAVAAGVPLAEAGSSGGATLGLAGGPFAEVTVPAGSALGCTLLGGYGAIKGGQVGYALGQAACSSGTGSGAGGSGKGGGKGTGSGQSGFNKNDPQHRNMTADQIISQFKKGSVRSAFPGQFLQKTFNEIDSLAKSGDDAAQTARKLLTDGAYNK